MKKLIAVSAVAALAATALSAEITFGSWGRALWVTAANAAYENGKDDKGNIKYYETIVTDVHQSAPAFRTGFREGFPAVRAEAEFCRHHFSAMNALPRSRDQWKASKNGTNAAF